MEHSNGGLGGQNSPLRGIEKLSDELKIERQKSTAALQERSRLRIEIESLRAENQNFLAQVDLFGKKIQAKDDENQEIVSRHLEIEERNAILIREIEEANRKLELFENDCMRVSRERDQLLEMLKEKEELEKNVSKQNDELEAKIVARESLIVELRQDVNNLRQRQLSFEEKDSHAAQTAQMNEQLMGELRVRAKRSEVVHESYQQQLGVNEDMKGELEKCLESNYFLSKQLKDAVKKNQELQASESNLHEILDALTIERDRAMQESRDNELAIEELTRRVRAEAEAAESAQLRAEVASKSKESVDDQLESINSNYRHLLESNGGDTLPQHFICPDR